MKNYTDAYKSTRAKATELPFTLADLYFTICDTLSLTLELATSQLHAIGLLTHLFTLITMR